MPTLQKILEDIKIRIPYSTDTLTNSRVIGWINDCQNEIWRYMASTEIYKFNIVAGQSIYNLPLNCKVDMIKSVLVSDSTVDNGNESYTPYKYAGHDDEVEGNIYYEVTDRIGIYPSPSTDLGTGYVGMIVYESSPTQLSENSLSVIPDINEEYQDILKWRACRDIAGSGHNPDDHLRDYYNSLYEKLLKKIRTDYYKRKAKNPKENYRRSESWWNG